MDPLAFLLVMTSAFSHATWNVLAKKGGNKESFMWIMITSSIFTLLPVYVLVLPDWRLPLTAVPYMLGSAVAETLYFISLSRAFELGDLSVVYPLARSSPLFLTVLAVVFLGESISFYGALGIALMVLGVYTIHLRSLNLNELTLPLRSLRNRASQYALLTALWTTFYSLFDKAGVTAVNPFAYSLWLEIFIAPMMTVVVLWRSGTEALVREWRDSKITAIVSGFLMRFGYFIVLWVMSKVQVSYVLALRQISVVLGAAAGVFLLGESYGKARLVSSVIMFFGIYLLAVLA
ncbi:MAG: EamA family transporter [Candidatus Bathyarchaeota archaeon]|jgi:drug/metabolite transporter (DMT)-like permease